VLIEIGGVRLLTDPVLRGRVAHLRRQGGGVDVAALGPLDGVLISHAHLDHLDLASLRLLAAEPGRERGGQLVGPSHAGSDLPALVVPPGTAGHLGDELVAGFAVEELAAGALTQVAGVPIRATPASHDSRRHPLGPAGEAIGYLIGDRPRVYFAGDTDLFPEMEQLAPNLDAALLPVWGWGPTLGAGHLDPEGAAEALTRLRPRIAIPIHWGTLFPVGLDRIGRRGRLLTDPPHEFARAAARLAPDVEVRVLEPGRATPLGSAR
jgi:L-ascorbate metabolism protein UlaG (beta-lactamase superfamily)